MKTRIKFEKRMVLALGVAMLAINSFGAPYVVLKNGQRKNGVDIRKMSNGDVMLTLAGGNQFTFTADQVDKAVADKPPYFDKAVAALRAGKADLAVQGFEKVVSDYKGLEWDVRAMPYLAQAYTVKGEPLKAERVFANLFKSNPDLRDNGEINVAYAKVLLKAKKTSDLQKQLDRMIASGDQKSAAFAQVMRGNIEMEKQDYKAAAKEYLRTVYFFRDQTEVMPEATFNLAEALDKMRDKRAKVWYSKVVDNYPSSEYVAKAKAKL